MLQKKRTLNDDSKAAYTTKALKLIKQFKKTSKLDNPEWDEFIEWLNNNKKKGSFATWRQYKASVAWFFKSQDLKHYATIVENLSNEGYKKQSNLTTSKKKKSLTLLEQSTIQERLKILVKENESYSKEILAYFNTILATAVRPTEIETMEIIRFPIDEFDGQPPILKVRNAKETNGRSFGEYRYIGLKNLSDKTMMYIEYSIASAKNPESPKGEK